MISEEYGNRVRRHPTSVSIRGDGLNPPFCGRHWAILSLLPRLSPLHPHQLFLTLCRGCRNSGIRYRFRDCSGIATNQFQFLVPKIASS